MNAVNTGADGSGLMTNNAGPIAPLQVETQTAHAALKTALLQLGLLSRFQRDVRTLGVQDYASKPPSNLTNALTQAVKAYNDACNAMELQIMRAKAALLHDGTGEEPSQGDEAVIENSNDNSVDLKTQDQDESMAGEPDEPSTKHDVDNESMTQPITAVEHEAPAVPEQQIDTTQPAQATAATSLLNVDDMEDLFGSGVSRSDTSTSTPANGGLLQAQQPSNEQSQSTEQPQSNEQLQSNEQSQNAQNQSAYYTADSTMSSYNASGMAPEGHNANASLGMPPIPSQTSGTADPTGSMFAFGDTSNTATGAGNMNFDFSNLTSDDFNSLLTSLGDSSTTGGQGDSGNGLLSGFNLDTDLSAFLNTDISSNQ